MVILSNNFPKATLYCDYLIKDWANANLPKPSMLRMKFATINREIFVKKLGKLSKKDIKVIFYE
jgi:mRNA interferase MazF